MQSQVGLRKHLDEQSWWRWWNSSWAISNPERWYCESAALNMPTIWKTQQCPQDWKRSVFIPIRKKSKTEECSNYRTIALIPHTSKVILEILQASTVCELWTSKCSSWMQKMQRNLRSNCQHLLDHGKSKRVPEKHLFLLYWLCQSLWLCGSQ